MDESRFGSDGLRGVIAKDYTIDPRGFTCHLAGGGRRLVRFSGTEPIIRVYSETTDEARVASLLDAGFELAGLRNG